MISTGIFYPQKAAAIDILDDVEALIKKIEELCQQMETLCRQIDEDAACYTTPQFVSKFGRDWSTHILSSQI
jgi:hypothetical protein